MKQRLSNVLAIRVTCPTNVVLNQPVVLSGDKTVAAISAAGEHIVGYVDVHAKDVDFCTIRTPYTERRDDRVSGAAVSVGPIVFDAAGKVINFVDATHTPDAIVGVALTAATGADETIETLEY